MPACDPQHGHSRKDCLSEEKTANEGGLHLFGSGPKTAGPAKPSMKSRRSTRPSPLRSKTTPIRKTIADHGAEVSPPALGNKRVFRTAAAMHAIPMRAWIAYFPV